MTISRREEKSWEPAGSLSLASWAFFHANRPADSWKLMILRGKYKMQNNSLFPVIAAILKESENIQG